MTSNLVINVEPIHGERVNNLKVQRADLDNIEHVAHLFDLYRQFYDQKSDIKTAVKFISDRMINNESIIFIAVEISGEPIGFCQLYPTFCSVIAEPILVLYDLYVIESKRKLGAGRELLLASEEYAKSKGVKRLDLTTAKTNSAAQSLYESLGWVKDNVFFTYNKIL